MTARMADRLAMPGDPSLDCHLTGLRLSSVVSPEDSDYDAEGMLLFDTTQASGWWIDSVTGEQVYPESVTELTITFGLDMEAGYVHLAGVMTARLRSWADTGVALELTCAPGKWTLLRSPADEVPIPRSRPNGEPGD